MKKKNSDLITIGNNIQNIREKEKLSQEELAFKAKMHRTYIGGIERGERNFTILNLIKIANALNTDPCLLIDLKTKEIKNE